MNAHTPRMCQRQTATGTIYLIYCPGCSSEGRPLGQTTIRQKALEWVVYHRDQYARATAQQLDSARTVHDPTLATRMKRGAREQPASRPESANGTSATVDPKRRHGGRRAIGGYD